MIPTTNIVSIVYQTLLFVIGVPGNVLIILTYGNRHRGNQRTSSGVFIIALALADLGVCLMSPVVIYNYVVYYDYPSEAFCKFRYYTNHGLIYVSRFLTIAVAIERYLAICKPMSKRISPKWATVISVACVPVSYLLTLPIAFAFGLRPLSGDRTTCYPDTSNPAIYWVLKVSFPITFLGGLIIVVVCYSLIYRAIRRQMTIRATMMNRGPRSSSVVSKSTDDSSSQRTAQTSFREEAKSSDSESNAADHKPAPNTQSGDSHAANGCEKHSLDSTIVTATNVKPLALSQHESIGDESKRDVERVANDRDDVEAAKDSLIASSRKKKAESKTKSKSNSMDSTTKMLLIVAAIYFISFLPQLITLMIPKAAFGDFRVNYKRLYNFFVSIRRLITINHVINPFVYGFVNQRFRQDCWAILKGLKARCCTC